MATCIFDGHYLLHRVLHVPQLRMLSNKDKKPTGGVFGFVKSLRSTLYSFSNVDRVIVVFDAGKSKRRLDLYPDYKGNRKQLDEIDPDGISYKKKFYMQKNYLRFLLPKMSIHVVEVSGKEGDDVIGMLLRKLPDNLRIVSSDDRDMYQFVSKNVHVWRPLAEELITEENFLEKTGLGKDVWLVTKAILGDDSDNIPGIKGIGPGTIKKYYDSFVAEKETDFLSYLASRDSKRMIKIVEEFDMITRNMQLLDTSLEEFSGEEEKEAIDKSICNMQFDIIGTNDIFKYFEFYSLLEDVSSWISRFQILK